MKPAHDMIDELLNDLGVSGLASAVSEPAPAPPSLPFARWKRLRSGAWGLSVLGVVKHGDEVIVTKRDGTAQSARVDVVLWTGENRKGQPVSICTTLPRNRAE